MADLSSLQGIKDAALGFLLAACLSLVAFIRRLDLSTINQRLDHLEREQDKLRGLSPEEGNRSRKEAP